jgi:uncharacterized membrane protein YeaQ/YmgE (transglycosylase-associated protein family)
MRILRHPLLIGALVVLYSLMLYALLPSDICWYVIVPGEFVGVIASVLISHNGHGGTIAEIVVVASIVNWLFYTILSYVILTLVERSSERRRRKAENRQQK